MAFISSGLMYVALNLIAVPPFDDFSAVRDNDTNEASAYNRQHQPFKRQSQRVVPEIADVDISRASWALYSSEASEKS